MDEGPRPSYHNGVLFSQEEVDKYGSAIGVLATVVVFGAGIGLATVGQTNMISCACSRENFGSASAVNSMILTIGMSAGPVVASLIIGGYADPGTGYAYCWGIAALLAVVAIILVLLNKADLGVVTTSPAPHEE